MEAIDPQSRPVQSFDWDVIKWCVTPDDQPGEAQQRYLGVVATEG